MNADGGAVTRLTDRQRGRHVARVVARRHQDRLRHQPSRRIELRDLRDERRRQRARRGSRSTTPSTPCPAWSPDGARIAFTSTRTGNGDIYVMNANGTAPTRLTTHAEGRHRAGLVARRHQDRLRHQPPRRLELRDLRDRPERASGQTRLTTNPAVDIQPAWSPDGTRIAFATNRHGSRNFELYTMTASGARQTRVTANPAADWFPDW